MHAEGKFGGPQPGSGRPRKKRAAELVAEGAAQDAEKIRDAFRRGIESPDAKTAVMAAEKYLGVESSEQDRLEREEKRLDNMNKDEIIAQMAEGFVRLAGRGVKFDFEGTATELEPAELPGG